MKILVTGGAGYIGSHVAKQLLENTDYEIFILDNFSTGSREALEFLKTIRNFEFKKLDLNKFKKVKKYLKQNKFDVIMHFAASIIVPESIEKPTDYYMNNTVNTANLIKCATQAEVGKFIFSSTAAVYGNPKEVPTTGIIEEAETKPINPYGFSKLMSEQVLQDTAKANKNFKFIIFRYFNVAGADIFYNNSKLSPRIGSRFPDATHLIKIASECAVSKRNKIVIFGNDFDTIDGTGVRDYIHIDDLSSAHIQAIDYLETNNSDTFNLGYGKGYSVKQVIQTMKEITNTNFDVDICGRRAGDPAMLIANTSKVTSKIKWQAKYNDLKLICESAYQWERIV